MLLNLRHKLLDSLLKTCSEYYQDNLVSLAVFGSVGRITMTQHSDLDFLVIAENLPRGRIKRVKGFYAVEEKMEPVLEATRRAGWQVDLSPLFKTPREVQAGGLLYLDMIDDAELLIDRDNFFSGYLKSLEKKLEAYKARKRLWKGSWYWEIKPDIKPGEVVDL